MLVLVSALAHLFAVSLVGFGRPKILYRDLPPEPTLTILAPPEFSRRRTPLPNERVKSAQSAAPTPARPTRSDVRQDAAAPAAAPKGARPPVSTTPPTSVAQGGSIQGASPSQSATVGDAVRAALRGGVGCDLGQLAHLTQDEQDRCNQRAAVVAKAVPKFDTIPQEKRAYYDAVQAAYQASRRPDAPLYRDANGNIASWGHPPGVGCGFRQRFRPGSSMSDKIKATGMIGVPIGPFSCGLALPQGSLTPEIGIPTP